MIKTLLWKYLYARRMQQRANYSFGRAWENACAWVEAFGIDEHTPHEAAEEEMSNWDGEGL
jgi:hypothetical protein